MTPLGARASDGLVAETAAIDASGACVVASSEASIWRPASKRCAATLGRLRPDAFPLATELRAAPTETFTWR